MHQSILFAILQSKMDYLDPGSGSMIIQMVIAAVLGLGVVIRFFWKNIKALFIGNKVEDQSDDPTAIGDVATIKDDAIQSQKE